MNILLLGSGGREHALAWAVLQNPKCDRLVVAPGNAGIAEIAECVPLDILDPAAVVALCVERGIDFAIIGPEAPLSAGVSDALRKAGFLTFGPSQQAAMLETSKAFTKQICDACAAPTAAWEMFTDADAARTYLHRRGAPIVIKADGLAAGKGVVVAMTLAEAEAAIDDLFSGSLGAAGTQVVIEDFLAGEEASFFVLADGTTALPIGTAQDHKRAFDGDKGPNTGGMGAYSPAPVMSDAVIERTMRLIIRPTLAEMARRGTPFQGVLFAGLMIENGNPRLIEYNTRFGDPECQVLAIRLGAQMLDLLLATARGELAGARVNWADDHALTVVMAAEGYPGSYARGLELDLPQDNTDPRIQVFHAGTRRQGDRIVSDGGRVLAVTARGASLGQARDLAYGQVARISFPGGFAGATSAGAPFRPASRSGPLVCRDPTQSALAACIQQAVGAAIRPDIGKFQVAARRCHRYDPVPVGMDQQQRRHARAFGNPAGDIPVAHPVIGQTAGARPFDQQPAAHGDEFQRAIDMRRLDIGDVQPPIAVEIGNPRRCQPAVFGADRVGRGQFDQFTPNQTIDRQRRTPALSAFDDDHLVAAIAIQITDARCQILEHQIGRQDHGQITRPPVRRGHAQAAGLELAAKDTVPIAVGRIGKPGPDDVAGRGTGLGGMFGRRLVFTRPGTRGPQNSGQRDAQADQICFSGICTTSPSRLSSTRNWQVSRDRLELGFQAKSSMSASMSSRGGSFSTQASST